MSKPSIESFIELGKKIDRLQTENLRYKQALRFYADERHWKDYGEFWSVVIDKGETARKALEEFE